MARKVKTHGNLAPNFEITGSIPRGDPSLKV